MGGSYRVVISGYDNICKVLKENHKITAKRSYAGVPAWKKAIFQQRPGMQDIC